LNTIKAFTFIAKKHTYIYTIIKMNVSFMSIPNKYIFVNDRNTKDILHLNVNILSHDNNHLNSIASIPVFRSLKMTTKFQEQIINKKNMRANWYASKDNKTNDCVICSHVTTKNYFDNLSKIKEFDMDNEKSVKILMTNNIGLFYVDDFLIKEHNEQLLLIGKIWTPQQL
jgi:hypothetical protein